MRILLLISVVFTAGCAVTLPAGDQFNTAMLERRSDEEALLFVYSMPNNQRAYYKHILIDGVRQSTITNETFARLVVSPGNHAVRISQHGWKNRIEVPPVFGELRNEEILALVDGKKDIEIVPGGVHFVSIHMKLRTIYYECGESATATQVCSKDVKGVVIEEPSREIALASLSSLREVCDECE
jgi:hypothetical protein